MRATAGVPLIERLIRKIYVKCDNSCWEWRGSRIRAGYGQVMANGQVLKVHRVVWELLIGPIPPGMTLDHLCRNTSCCNPAHLEVVTIQVNLSRGYGWGAVNTRKTHCPAGHLLEGPNLHIARSGSRTCRVCGRDRQRNYRDRQRVKT